MTLAQRLLNLLLSDDASQRVQGGELLSSAPELAAAIFGIDGVAWQAMAGVRLALARSGAAPETQCQWGLDCTAEAMPLVSQLAPDTHHYGLASLSALAAGAPPDTPIAIAEFIHQLRTAAREAELEGALAEDLLITIDALLSHLRVWFNSAAFIEDHHPDDDLGVIHADIESARVGVMREWASLAGALHRIHAAAQGPEVLAAAIHWQSAHSHHALFADA